MKPIKSVTFESIDNLSNELFKHIKEKISLNLIKILILDYLMTDGHKKFIEVYNEFFQTKDIPKALITLKIQQWLK